MHISSRLLLESCGYIIIPLTLLNLYTGYNQPDNTSLLRVGHQVGHKLHESHAVYSNKEQS